MHIGSKPADGTFFSLPLLCSVKSDNDFPICMSACACVCSPKGTILAFYSSYLPANGATPFLIRPKNKSIFSFKIISYFSFFFI